MKFHTRIWTVLDVRLKILSFLLPRINLNYLEADHPVFHLIVYPDGSTNQPTPKDNATSNKSTADQIFDLAINRAEVRDGLVLFNRKRFHSILQRINLV